MREVHASTRDIHLRQSSGYGRCREGQSLMNDASFIHTIHVHGPIISIMLAL